MRTYHSGTLRKKPQSVPDFFYFVLVGQSRRAGEKRMRRASLHVAAYHGLFDGKRRNFPSYGATDIWPLPLLSTSPPGGETGLTAQKKRRRSGVAKQKKIAPLRRWRTIRFPAKKQADKRVHYGPAKKRADKRVHYGLAKNKADNGSIKRGEKRFRQVRKISLD